jgi:transcriptional regulator with XRE-family HTH domain
MTNMGSKNLPNWKAGRDLPYVIPFGESGMLAILLREAMGLSQEQFGRKLGVTKTTVSRCECGRMRPSAPMAAAIRKLQALARQEGVKIDGEKRVGGHPSSSQVHAARA